MVLDSSKSMVPILGCAHFGMIHIIHHIIDKMGKEEFYAILGGTHLNFLTPEQLEESIKFLKTKEIYKIGASYCTGMKAGPRLFQEFGERFFSADVWELKWRCIMINLNILGWGDVDIENLILDLNGTLATDGEIPLEVKREVEALCKEIKIYILTADTQATAYQITLSPEIKLIKVPERGSSEEKLKFLQSLDPSRTVSIGNGNNDRLILKEAALGIAVLGEEGCAISALENADILVKNVVEALDLFLKPKRLMATLRE